jgi:hypothetical protein
MSLSRLIALEKPTYPLFNDKIEANNQVPQNGDEVMIVEQCTELEGSASSWMAGLSQGQDYTQSSWSDYYYSQGYS